MDSIERLGYALLVVEAGVAACSLAPGLEDGAVILSLALPVVYLAVVVVALIRRRRAHRRAA